jgi:hypothetical protein
MARAPARAALAEQVARRRAAGEQVTVVVDGEDARQADALQRKLGSDVRVIHDPGGAIAQSLGVRVWPTTITVDGFGQVRDVEVGAPNDAAPLAAD